MLLSVSPSPSPPCLSLSVCVSFSHVSHSVFWMCARAALLYWLAAAVASSPLERRKRAFRRSCHRRVLLFRRSTRFNENLSVSPVHLSFTLCLSWVFYGYPYYGVFLSACLSHGAIAHFLTLPSRASSVHNGYQSAALRSSCCRCSLAYSHHQPDNGNGNHQSLSDTVSHSQSLPISLHSSNIHIRDYCTAMLHVNPSLGPSFRTTLRRDHMSPS